VSSILGGGVGVSLTRRRRRRDARRLFCHPFSLRQLLLPLEPLFPYKRILLIDFFQFSFLKHPLLLLKDNEIFPVSLIHKKPWGKYN
jgi:hypothetical protein